MKKQLLIWAIILLLIAVELTGCLGIAYKEFNGEYVANENTTLTVTNINGEIEINSWDGDTITLNAVIKSYQGDDELEKIKIDVVESDDAIDIETIHLGTGIVEASTDMTIKIPTYVTIDFVSTSNGDVQITGTKGNTTAHSSNGIVKLEDIDGYVTAHSSNGNIDVKETIGIGDLETSNGEISAEIFDFQENISIASSNGDITVYLNPSLNATLEMTTSNGQITTSGLSLNITTSEEKHKAGTLGEGGNTLDIHTSNGNINLYALEE